MLKKITKKNKFYKMKGEKSTFYDSMYKKN